MCPHISEDKKVTFTIKYPVHYSDDSKIKTKQRGHLKEFHIEGYNKKCFFPLATFWGRLSEKFPTFFNEHFPNSKQIFS